MYKLNLNPMKNFLPLFLALCLLFVNCTNTEKKIEDDDVKVIDIVGNIHKNRKVTLSTIASNIEYHALETDEKCLITPLMNIHCLQDYIIAIGNQSPDCYFCYVFDRKTGAFIRQISSQGQGPDEYSIIYDVFSYGDTILISADNGKDLLLFNIDGTLSHKVKRTNPSIDRSIVYKYFHVRQGSGFGERIAPRVCFLDRTGELVDSIPEYRALGMTRNHFRVDGIWLYVFHDNLYYKDWYCDTLYHIKDYALHPRYIFDTGNLAPPYKIQQELRTGRYDRIAGLSAGIAPDMYEKYILVSKVLEESKHLYFAIEYRGLSYPAIYNKPKDEIQIMSPVPIPPPNKDSRPPLHGFENDLDGGLPFWPQQMISDREMMRVYTAEELLGLDASKITDEKLKNVLNNLKEDSNPVVAIVTK